MAERCSGEADVHTRRSVRERNGNEREKEKKKDGRQARALAGVAAMRDVRRGGRLSALVPSLPWPSSAAVKRGRAVAASSGVRESSASRSLWTDSSL